MLYAMLAPRQAHIHQLPARAMPLALVVIHIHCELLPAGLLINMYIFN